MGGASAIVSLLLFVGAIFLAILAIFMPWYVYRIYQESKETNRLMRKALQKLDPDGAAKEAADAARRARVPAVYRQ